MSDRPLEHNWSGWPGAWCMNCGMDEVNESALGCRDCKWSGGEMGIANVEYCADHQEWATRQSGECPGPVDAHNPYVKKARP